MKKTAIVLGTGILLLSGLSAIAGTVSADEGRQGRKVVKHIGERHPEIHKLMVEGKFDEARQIRAELGLGMHGKRWSR